MQVGGGIASPFLAKEKKLKLSEMDSAKKLRTMGRLVPVLARIGEDPDLSDALAKGREDRQGTLLQQLSRLAKYAAPVVLESHADDLLEIVSILTGEPIETVRAPGYDILKALHDNLDRETVDFFIQSGHLGRKPS